MYKCPPSKCRVGLLWGTDSPPVFLFGSLGTSLATAVATTLTTAVATSLTVRRFLLHRTVLLLVALAATLPAVVTVSFLLGFGVLAALVAQGVGLPPEEPLLLPISLVLSSGSLTRRRLLHRCRSCRLGPRVPVDSCDEGRLTQVVLQLLQLQLEELIGNLWRIPETNARTTTISSSTSQ